MVAPDFAAEAEEMPPVGVGQHVRPGEGLGPGSLVGERGRSDGKEPQHLDVGHAGELRPQRIVDPELSIGERFFWARRAVDAAEAEASFIDEPRPKDVGIGESQHAVAKLDVATVSRHLERIDPDEGEERLELRGIREKEFSRELVIPGDVVIHVHVELVFAEARDSAEGRTDGSGGRCSGGRRSRTRNGELSAQRAAGESLLEQGTADGIERHPELRRKVVERCVAPVIGQSRRKVGESQAVAQGSAIALARALVGDKKERLVLDNMAAKSAAELVALKDRSRAPFGVHEEVVGIEDVVAEEFVHVAVELVAS